MRSLLAATTVLLACVAACAPSSREPAVVAQRDAVLDEDARLDAAVAAKRAGDPFGAWRFVETIPEASPARLDPRYAEVLGAYSDARARQLGQEISADRAAHGGGPPAEDAPRVLTSRRIEDHILDQRARLRTRCYGNRDGRVSFRLHLRIDTDGDVVDASVSDVQGDATVAQCVRARARAWVFDPSAEGAEYSTLFLYDR